MPRRNRNEVSATLTDSNDLAVAIRGTYHAGTSDYFDRSWGNWLPGDPEDIDILGGEAEDEGANVEEVLADVARCEEAIREAALIDAESARIDDAYDRWRDEQGDDERRYSRGG
jgi:hypothetical protein